MLLPQGLCTAAPRPGMLCRRELHARSSRFFRVSAPMSPPQGLLPGHTSDSASPVPAQPSSCFTLPSAPAIPSTGCSHSPTSRSVSGRRPASYSPRAKAAALSLQILEKLPGNTAHPFADTRLSCGNARDPGYKVRLGLSRKACSLSWNKPV